MDHRHPFRGIVASNGEGLQLTVYIDSAHPDIQRTAVAENFVDSPHLKVQVLLHILPLSLSPSVQKFPHILNFLTGKSSVFIASLILLYKTVQVVFFLVELFACKGL